jgi:signal transduction histidine kinase
MHRRSSYQISVRGKFLLAIGTIVALTAVAVWVAIGSLSDIQSSATALSRQQVPGIERAARISTLSNALALDAARLAQAVNEPSRKGAHHAFSVRFSQLKMAVSNNDAELPNRTLETQMALLELQAKSLNDLVAKQLQVRESEARTIDEIQALHQRFAISFAAPFSVLSQQPSDDGTNAQNLTSTIMGGLLDRTLARAAVLLEIRMAFDQALEQAMTARENVGGDTGPTAPMVPDSIRNLEEQLDRYQGLGGEVSEQDRETIIVALRKQGDLQTGSAEAAMEASPGDRAATRTQRVNSWLEAQIRAEALRRSHAVDAARRKHEELIADLLTRRSQNVNNVFQTVIDLKLLFRLLLQGALEGDVSSLKEVEQRAVDLFNVLNQTKAPGLQASFRDGFAELGNLIDVETGIFAIAAQRLELESKTRQATQGVLFGTRAIASTAHMITDEAVRTMTAQSSNLESSVEGDRLILTSVGVFSVALALLIWLFVVDRSLSKPLQHLIEATQALASGNLGIAIPEGNRRDEIGAMSRALDVFKQNANDLQVALEREKELNSLQRQFVAMVSHEFRTPLAIISGTAQRLRRKFDKMTGERRLDALQRIEIAVARLIQLIESVLSISRLEAGKLQLNVNKVDLAAVTSEIAASLGEVHTRHRLETTVDGLITPIDADEMLLRQALINLISNAFKYSPEGSCIRVHGEQRDGHVAISVADEGVGIPEEELPRLFERFFRASTSTGIPGTGIGLNLVRHIVEMHDGQVSVTSEVNAGTTFRVSLPSTLSVIDEGADNGQAQPLAIAS